MGCAVSPTGRFLAFAGDDGSEDPGGNIRQRPSLGQGHSGSIKALSWTPDERQLVTGGDDHCLCIWNFYLGGLPKGEEKYGGDEVDGHPMGQRGEGKDEK